MMDKKDSQKEVFTFIFLVFLSLSLVLVKDWGVTRSVRGLFERPIMPLQRFTKNLSSRIFSPLTFLGEWRTISEDNQLLQEEVARLSVLVGEFSVCQEEREAMRQLIDAPLPSSWHFIPAKAVGVENRLKLNVGKKAGVEEGLMVVSQNILVGRIETVSPYSSQVALINDPQLVVPVVVRFAGGRGVRAEGLLSGYLNDKLIVRQLVWEDEVGVGDLVFTSGEGGWLADLLVGRIVQVREEEGKTFRQGVVEPFVDVLSVDHVFVVKNINGEKEE